MRKSGPSAKRTWGGIDTPAPERGQAIELHRGLILSVVALIAIGCLSVYSATVVSMTAPYAYITKHLVNIALGFVAAYVVYHIPLRFFDRYWLWFGGAAFVLLVAVLIPGIGVRINGASRWIPLGFMNFQVTESAKLAALVCTAAFTVRQQDFMHSVSRGFGPMAAFMGALAFLIMLEPDLGSTVVIVAIIMGVLFIGGLSLKIFTGVISIVAALVCWIIIDSPWRLGRVMAFWDPWADEHVLSTSYQLSHSLIAFGRGELFGVGLGSSVEKLYYLPEAHTDFILAVWAEETGFVGVCLVVALFYWMVRQAFEIGRQAVKLDRFFAGLLAQGVGVWLGVQACINIGVASGAFPTKGLTLPFVSYGGSAMVASLVAVALLLRVDYENKIHMRGGEV